jgi:hypothetical protein
MIFEFASKVNAGEKGSYWLARFAARGISLHGDEKSMNKLRVNLEQKKLGKSQSRFEKLR